MSVEERDEASEVTEVEEKESAKFADLRAVTMPSKIVFLDTDEILMDETLNIRRFSPGARDIQDLAKDIASNGQTQPVLVRKSGGRGENPMGGKYALVDGFQRTKAIIYANENGLTVEPIKVAAIVVDLNETEAFNAALSTFKRFNLSPIDTASIVKTMHEAYGFSLPSIAKRFGHDRSWANRIIKLTTLRPKLQKLIHEGKLPSGNSEMLVEMTEEEQDKYVTDLENGNSPKRDDVRKAHKRKKAKAKGQDAAVPLSLRELRAMFERMSKVDEDGLVYSERIQAVAKGLVKVVDGRMGEKALATLIEGK
jgi:ParB/RepB/Spo0J family partition protein